MVLASPRDNLLLSSRERGCGISGHQGGLLYKMSQDPARETPSILSEIGGGERRRCVRKVLASPRGKQGWCLLNGAVKLIGGTVSSVMGWYVVSKVKGS